MKEKSYFSQDAGKTNITTEKYKQILIKASL